MKNEKGFTLIEIITVIVVLSVISLIITPIVIDQIHDSKEKAYVEQTVILEETAERWAIKNAQLLSQTKNYYLTIDTLVKDNYLTSNKIIDPRTNEKMKGCLVISYDSGNSQYDFNYNENTCADLKK